MSKKRDYVQLCECCCLPIKKKGNKYSKKFCSPECKKKFQVGGNHPSYKGGRYISSDGYVMTLIPGKGKYIAEHRHIIENEIGRKLNPFEVVHHVDRDKSNNRRENLFLLTTQEHSKLHCVNNDVVVQSKKKGVA